MTDADVAEAGEVAWTALLTAIPAEFDTDDPAGPAYRQLRIRHVLETDPGGAWVATDTSGRIVGMSLALVREGMWGFSLFGVLPELHGQRIGTRLFDAALAHGDGTRAGIILSTVSPAAMRRYFRSGFRLLPCVCASGALNSSRIPGGLQARPGDPATDVDTIDRASRHVRGASHARDIESMLASGGGLLVIEGSGFAVQKDGSPWLLAATDEGTATDLLWSCFAAAKPGTTVRIDFVSAGNDWALDVALTAGLTLTADEGPIFVRGDIGPLVPYLPSGAYL